MPAIRIPIPPNSDVFIKKGDSIKEGKLIARAAGEVSAEIAVHKLLKISADKVGAALVKKEGDKIKKGEVLARRQGILSSTNIKSPLDGILEPVEGRAGCIRIRSSGKKDIFSPAKGKIEAVAEDYFILRTEEAVIACGFGRGNAKGELFACGGGGIFGIDKSVCGKIVFGRGLDAASAAKIGALGGAGVVLDKDYGKGNLPYVVLEDKDILEKYTGRNGRILNKGGSHFLIIGL